MFPRAFAAILIACAACAPSAGGVAQRPSAAPERERSSPEPERERRFDDLTLTLELEAATVESGAEFAGELVVENRSGHDVVDPGCWLAASSSGVVPPDDPDAELWQQVVVDCSGPHTIRPGEDERYVMTFVAATMHGDPLPPGDYVVAVEYRGLSRRIEVPVSVTG